MLEIWIRLGIHNSWVLVGSGNAGQLMGFEGPGPAPAARDVIDASFGWTLLYRCVPVPVPVSRTVLFDRSRPGNSFLA